MQMRALKSIEEATKFDLKSRRCETSFIFPSSSSLPSHPSAPKTTQKLSSGVYESLHNERVLLATAKFEQ
jgi:hypothetical protein